MKQGGHGGNVYKASKTLGINLKDVHDYSSNVSPFQAEVLKGVDLMELTSRLPEPPIVRPSFKNTQTSMP